MNCERRLTSFLLRQLTINFPSRRRINRGTGSRQFSSVLSGDRRNSHFKVRNTAFQGFSHKLGFSTSNTHHGSVTNIIKSPLSDLEIPESPFLAHYIMEKWEQYSNKIALINGETGAELTYGQLKTKIAKLSSALVRNGFTKGDVMTIITPNCPEFCILYMAAASIGIVISSVNPLYTKDELVHALNLSESKLLAFSGNLVQLVDATLPFCPSVKKTISIGSVSGHEAFDSLLSGDSSEFPESVEYHIDDTIALPFSSGTSGPPKGVMLTSYNIVSNLIQMGNPDFLDPLGEDTYLCVLPMFHIFAQSLVMFIGLCHGASIVSMSKFDPVAFLELIQKYKPSHLHLVPPIMLFLAKHPIVDKYDLSCVRYFFYAAAPMSTTVLAEVQDRIGKNAIFSQGYGMTELSPGSHINPTFHRKPETIGVAIPNTQFRIRDIVTNEWLPANSEGELCIKGPQVMKGYFKNDVATRDTIIDDWLHTGDIAYYDDSGYVSITDRLKELIKFKGFQVAPAEIEDLLLRHPSVQDVAVIGKPDDAAGELPRAYIVLKSGVKTTEQDIQNFVKEKAAPYKQLRGGIEFLQEIPKAASGKILRRVLREDLRQKMSQS